MNFMWLSHDPAESARFNVDKHVVKLGTEACQCLSTAHPSEIAPYHHSHVNHPLCVWSRQSLSNYLHFTEFARALFAEYSFRYNRRHKAEDALDWLVSHLPRIDDVGLTRIPRCFAEWKGIIPETDDVTQDYRTYYLVGKTHLFKWKKREVPEWAIVANEPMRECA